MESKLKEVQEKNEGRRSLIKIWLWERVRIVSPVRTSEHELITGQLLPSSCSSQQTVSEDEFIGLQQLDMIRMFLM